MIRFFSQQQFEDILRERWGLEKTVYEVELFVMWKTPKGDYVMVPKLDGYVTL